MACSLSVWLLHEHLKIFGDPRSTEVYSINVKIQLQHRFPLSTPYGKESIEEEALINAIYTIRPEGRGNIGHSRPVVRIVWPEGALAPEGQTIRTNWSGMTDFAPARGSDCSYHIHTHIMHCWQMLFHFNRLQFKSKSNSDQLLRSGLVSLLINAIAWPTTHAWKAYSTTTNHVLPPKGKKTKRPGESRHLCISCSKKKTWKDTCPRLLLLFRDPEVSKYNQSRWKLFHDVMSFPIAGGAVANRLRHRTSDQTVLGSNPAVAAALSPWTRLFTPIVPRRSLHMSFY